MQRRRDAPHDAIPNEPSEPKREEIIHERRACELPECDGAAHATRDDRDLALRLLPGRDGGDLGLLRRRRRRDDRRGRRARRGREPDAVVQHDGPAHDFVVEVNGVVSVAGPDGEEELGDVVRVERRGLRGEPRGEVGVA